MKTTIGFLRYGDFFWFDDVKYKVGHLITNTNGYVACTNTVTKKVKRFYIDTTVEIKENRNLAVNQQKGIYD